MAFRKITSLLSLATLAANSEPLITLQEASGTDKLRVELLNLEMEVALRWAGIQNPLGLSV
jgi:hypothetical protein